MIGGAILAPVIITATSLTTSLVVLGSATVLVTVLCRAGLRGLDALSRARSELLASRVAVLQQLPVVSGATLVVLEQLASASQVCPLPAGVDIVVEGAPAHAFYAVIDGRVVVHHEGEGVARLGPGDFFGERGLLDRAPRNATVTTEVPTTVLRLEGDVLLDVLQSAPTVLSAIDRSSSQRNTPSAAPVRTTLVDDPTWAEV
jgi:signal-transduction protein with cAMP-binding, CBS, and nucleotidyltransferase domain